MSHAALVFAAPYRVEVQRSVLGSPGPGEALVKTLVSAISSGTEMLLYRGQMPGEMPVDESITALNGTFQYPIKYGYAAVGRVEEVGSGEAGVGPGDLVFSFRPHESSFISPASELIKVPDGISAEDAAFLPTMETAVNLVMDGQPSIGEQVAVFGQGVVGLLVTALLSDMPLASLVTIDQHERRRRESLALGATASLAPDYMGLMQALQGSRNYRGADLSFELSGNPATLDQAVKTAGYNGRIVVGSWYGTKESRLDLGGQVSQRPHQAYQQPGEHDCSRVVGAVVQGAPVRSCMVDDKEAASVPARVTHIPSKRRRGCLRTAGSGPGQRPSSPIYLR